MTATASPTAESGPPAAISADAVGVAIDGRPIVTNATLEVATGEWVTILGPNGAGKTTLLRALAGLQPATGRIDVHGQALAAIPARERARTIAVVNQLPLVPPAMTVTHYVLLGRTAHLGPLGRESARDLRIVDDALGELDLHDLADRPMGTLSGGERQRALLARGVAQQASILLLDEPTTSLDIAHQQETLAVVDRLRLRLRLTVVSTMHDLTLAGRYADRLVLMADGRIEHVGTPEAVLTADALHRHYGIDVEVITHRGQLVVIPLPGPSGPAAARSPEPTDEPEHRSKRKEPA